MREKLTTIGQILLMPAIFIGGILLIFFFIRGSVWLSEIFYPILEWVSGVVFIICLLVLAPLALFKKTREYSGVGFFISSYIIGITVWMWAIIIAYDFWGLTGLIIGLCFAGVGVVPVAILAALFHGNFLLCCGLILNVVLVFGFRTLGIYLTDSPSQGA